MSDQQVTRLRAQFDRKLHRWPECWGTACENRVILTNLFFGRVDQFLVDDMGENTKID